MLAENGYLLRIFISESDKHDGKPLHEWIARAAQQANLAGLTIIRGMEGFGAHKELHTSKLLDMSFQLPLVLHIIDEQEKIEQFLTVLDAVIPDGLITVEPVHMRVYRSKK